MQKMWRSISGLVVVAAAAAPMATAQVSPGTEGAPLVQRSPGGIAYISGGAGQEDRATMAARTAEFPVKVVLSATGGEYIVADSLRVNTPQGEVLVVRDAGPIVMMNLPAGQYTLEATYQGQTQRKSLRTTASAQTIEWRFPG